MGTATRLFTIMSSSIVASFLGALEASLSVLLTISYGAVAARFNLLWPVISIGAVYLIASKTNLLDDDPILWFVLMLMPTGPSATKLTALADVSGGSEEDKHAIAKFITLSYTISPLICFTVVG